MYAVRGLATLVGIRSFIPSRAPLSFLRPFRVPPPPEIDGKTRSFPFLALRFRLPTPRDGHGETDGEEELFWVEEWGRMCPSPSPWFSLLKTPSSSQLFFFPIAQWVGESLIQFSFFRLPFSFPSPFYSSSCCSSHPSLFLGERKASTLEC